MSFSLQDLFSLLGTFFSIVLGFTPIAPFAKVLQKKEPIDILPEGMLLSTIIARILFLSIWTVKKLLIPIINSTIGVLVSSTFFIIYLYLYFQKCHTKFISILFFLVFATILYLGSVFVQIEYKFDIGTLAMIFNILMYIAPGQKIGRVIKEKNYKLIPIWSTIASALCSLFWLLYGICIKYLPSILPNVLGLLFSTINSVIWLIFYLKRDKEEEGEEKLNIEMKIA